MLIVIVEVLNQYINTYTKCNSMMDSCDFRNIKKNDIVIS
jgi:translation initiation factor 2 beta subunit (eIF-2beta)/eIF-5